MFLTFWRRSTQNRALFVCAWTLTAIDTSFRIHILFLKLLILYAFDRWNGEGFFFCLHRFHVVNLDEFYIFQLILHNNIIESSSILERLFIKNFAMFVGTLHLFAILLTAILINIGDRDSRILIFLEILLHLQVSYIELTRWFLICPVFCVWWVWIWQTTKSRVILRVFINSQAWRIYNS